MTHDEIISLRYDAATAESWPCRSILVAPAGWHEVAESLAGHRRAEVRVPPCALDGLSAAEMVAASALRDAGVGLALSGAGRPEHLRWLRMLPWSAVIAHPALLRCTPAPDRVRVVESWADAASRRGFQFVAAVEGAPELPSLRSAGFTHAEVPAA